MLLGLLEPDAGRVDRRGGAAAAVRRGRNAAMLQDGGLMPAAKVAELVDFVRGLYPDPLPLRQVLRAANLEDLAGRRVDRLSGGQAQRVRFALALAGNLEILVLDEPADAVRRVVRGERVVDPGLAADALSTGPNPLSPRERDVLAAAAGGATLADVAAGLFLSEGTGRNDLSAAIRKTGARNRIEAARVAERNGWL